MVKQRPPGARHCSVRGGRNKDSNKANERTFSTSGGHQDKHERYLFHLVVHTNESVDAPQLRDDVKCSVNVPGSRPCQQRKLSVDGKH